MIIIILTLVIMVNRGHHSECGLVVDHPEVGVMTSKPVSGSLPRAADP